MELTFFSPSGPWLAPPPLCSAPDLPRRVRASVQQVCLVTFSPKLASPLLKQDIRRSPSSLEVGKWVAVAKAAAPSRPLLPRLHLFLPSHHVPTPTNFLSLAGWANLYTAGRVPITPFTCLSSLRKELQIASPQSRVGLLQTLTEPEYFSV